MRLQHLLAFIFAVLCAAATCTAEERPPFDLQSPAGQVRAAISLDGEGRPSFTLKYRGQQTVAGRLGLALAEGGELRQGFKVAGIRRRSHDQTYSIAVGKTSRARDQHAELVVSLHEAAGRRRELDVEFRAFDDGLAFRYVIPEQAALGEFVLTEEMTELQFAGDPPTRLLPLNSYTTSYEKHYQTLPVSKITPEMLVGLPLLIAGDDEAKIANAGPARPWLAVTEADLTDYAGMYLAGVAERPGTLVSKLSPLPGRDDGAKVLGTAPFATPWRIIMVGDGPGQLLESNIVFNLSRPCAIDDTSWIKPGKTTFPWWNHYALEGVDFEPGVNTATMKYYIDFCAEQGIDYHSLDGLDIAWYGGPIAPSGPTDVTRAAPSIDMPELLRYAKEKGVRLRLWMHWKALKPQIDEAFATYERWGIEGVMVDFMDRDDQEMVRFYHEMAEKAARHHLTVTLHGAYKPTGMERTWPNVLTYEAALNQEYNKWAPAAGGGTPPEHNLDIAFVRMLAGPLDYHQGGMRNVLTENYQPRDVAPMVQGTRGHQLAMYVVYQNHLPMMADSPTAYRGQPGLDFMVEAPTTWDETRVLHAELGQCLVIARRQGDAWYLGGMTAQKAQDLELKLERLGGGPYVAQLWLDQPGDPTIVRSERRAISDEHVLKVYMPREGGFVARLTKGAP
ncbi:MAG: glycoside hydrolase family 97 protein [Pirellulales bacterium]|nr:glycoside hydrolase family 97 protein [Pirellulales bacterium]